MSQEQELKCSQDTTKEEKMNKGVQTRRQQEQCPWEERGFKEAEEESAHDEPAKTLHQSREGRDGTPKRHAHGQVYAGADAGEYHVGRYLQRDVPGKEDGDGCVVLLALQAKIQLDPLDAGIGKCVTIEVAFYL